MLGVMTSHEIRVIRRNLIAAGFECHVGFGNRNSVVFDVNWVGHFGNAWNSGIEAVCFFIRNSVADNVYISYVDGVDGSADAVGHYEDGFNCSVRLQVVID